MVTYIFNGFDGTVFVRGSASSAGTAFRIANRGCSSSRGRFRSFPTRSGPS